MRPKQNAIDGDVLHACDREDAVPVADDAVAADDRVAVDLQPIPLPP
jgi:hypothetical protein